MILICLTSYRSWYLFYLFYMCFKFCFILFVHDVVCMDLLLCLVFENVRICSYVTCIMSPCCNQQDCGFKSRIQKIRRLNETLNLAAWSCLMGFKACWCFPSTKNHSAPTTKKNILSPVTVMYALLSAVTKNLCWVCLARLVGNTNLHTFLVGAFFETPWGQGIVDW